MFIYALCLSSPIILTVHSYLFYYSISLFNVYSLFCVTTSITLCQSCIGSAASDARHRAGNKDRYMIHLNTPITPLTRFRTPSSLALAPPFLTNPPSQHPPSPPHNSLYSKESGEFHLPLLSLPKALEPFLAICLHALMNGSPQQRETAADVISEVG